MDFELTEEQEMLKESIRKFIAKECPREYARELDEKEQFPHEVWKKMSELGWLGLPVPEEHGGMGGNILDQTIMIEELSRGMTSLSYAYFLSSCFGGKSIDFFGNEEQKKEYLPRLCRGEIKFALGLTEPSGGTDVLAMKAFAEEDGDSFVINGQKIFTSLGHESEYIITVVRTDKNPPKKSMGFSVFVVDSKAPGVEIHRIKTLGIHATGTNSVFYNDVRVPRECLLGEKDKGWYGLLGTLNNERILTAALDVGITQAVLEDAIAYANERHAFGRPIAQYQLIQDYIARIATGLETSRLLTYKAAWMQSLGKSCGREATMAKYHASEVAFEAADMGISILGGYGYTMEYDMQRYWRDSRLNRIGPVSNEMAKLYIAQTLGCPKSY
jgi:acyl-CoA dehydrogenase